MSQGVDMNMPRPPLVALVTDFGRADAFVGEMHLAILRVAPHVRIVDVTHDIAPYDRTAAALAAERALALLPPGAALVVVVDPGVGTSRRRIVRVDGGRFLVGPDNGVFPASVESAITYAIDPNHFAPRPGVRTFDGREVFGPVAALLACGSPVSRVGAVIDDAVPCVLPGDASFQDGVATGVVLALDRFGNAVTNIRLTADDVGGAQLLTPEAFGGPVRTSYHDVPHRAPFAIVGSVGRLELSRREAPSGLEVGTRVVLRRAP